VVHVAAAVGGEADGDFGDAGGVLEAAFVVVAGVVGMAAGGRQRRGRRLR
jgi:hypothetical protein